jgi:large subunit ribosomal protein L10
LGEFFIIMPSAKNIDQLNILKQNFKQSKSAVLVDFQGLNVEQMSRLRQKLTDQGGKLQVFKNTLIMIGLKQESYPLSDLELTTPTAILFCYEDEIAPIKTLYQYFEAHDLPKVKIGYLDRQFLSYEKVIGLAKLPSQDILQAKLVGVLNSPISGLVYVLQANLAKFINVLNQIKDNKQS